MGLLDLSISIVIILFILSIMTEKFTQLVKDYPTVFNVLLLLLSVAMIVRRVMIAYLPGENLLCRYIFGISLLIINSIFIWLFIKFKQQFSWFLLGFVIVNVTIGAIHAYDLYLTTAFILMFTCLTGLKVIPEISFGLGNKTTTTTFFKRIEKRTDIVQDSEKREKEITSLSFTVGLVIAYFFKGDFFTIINELGKSTSRDNSDLPSLGWDPFPLSLQPDSYFVFERCQFDPKFALGLLLTGFFLSFGSKFFHDLLETLFYAKRAKAALNDPKTFEQDSADKVREFVNNYDIKDLYIRKKQLFLNKAEVTGIAIGTVVNSSNQIRSSGIIVYVKEPIDVQANFRITKGNQILDVPYEVVQVSDYSTVSSSSADVSIGVTNAIEQDLAGSFTYPVEVVTNGTTIGGNYILTCYHVVKHSSHRWSGVNSDFTDVADQAASGIPIGHIIRGGRNMYAEAAVIELDKKQMSLSKDFLLTQDVKIVGSREVTKDDINKKVFMYSRKKKQMQTGWIRTIEIADKINFKDSGAAFEMHNLIQVEGEDGAIQEDGDSGNLLFDRDGFALGIVFARQEQKYTLAMRMTKALELLKDDNTTIKIKT